MGRHLWQRVASHFGHPAKSPPADAPVGMSAPASDAAPSSLPPILLNSFLEPAQLTDAEAARRTSKDAAEPVAPQQTDCRDSVPAPPRKPSRLALALQGGGAHGAFTWGVLDRLLDEPEISIDAISGASAGALNAVALTAGHLQGGRAGAQEMLGRLWLRIADLASMSPLQPMPMERFTPGWRSDWSPGHLMLDFLSRFVSPYQFNPFGIDPLRQVLQDLIDFDSLRRPEAIRLFVAATQLDTGDLRVFSNEAITVETVLASGCLPSLNQAIRLDENYYWDGGYSGNPALLPLLMNTAAREILLVRIDPKQVTGVPMTVNGIRRRLNRIMFNAPLNAELRFIDWLRQELNGPMQPLTPVGQRLKQLRIQSLSADDFMVQLDDSSKLTPDLDFINRLHQVGRKTAEQWLQARQAASPPITERD
jgi:NTE family protein